jgi:RNA polymerase sigma factor for flagellar operon FliA
MSVEQTAEQINPRVEAGLPFVEALARRVAATMPHSIDLGDLAMIDALRKDAWPRGVRRVRRELEAARERLRLSLGHEPSLADLAAAVGSDEERLGKVIVRINTIEQTSPLSCADNVDESQLPAVLVPVEAERPDAAYERQEVQDRVRGAIAALPPRERRVIALYYYGEVTMKEIGAELGVNESRVSQLHARALRRLREALGPDATPVTSIETIRQAVVAFEQRPRMAKAALPAMESVVGPDTVGRSERRGVVIDYASASRAARSKSPSRNGFDSHRHPLSSRKRSASVPATSPVTKITRRASAGVAAVMAR